jgi:hypothetical protein
MDAIKTAELKRFLSAITDPNVRPFIDLAKLHGSGIYNLAVQMATEHASAHGDFGPLNNLLALHGEGAYANAFISGLRSKLSFVVVGSSPRKLKKATPEQAAEAMKRAPVATPAARTSTRTTARKPERRKIGDDLLDSRLMLPGSFGHGKRR